MWACTHTHTHVCVAWKSYTVFTAYKNNYLIIVVLACWKSALICLHCLSKMTKWFDFCKVFQMINAPRRSNGMQLNICVTKDNLYFLTDLGHFRTRIFYIYVSRNFEKNRNHKKLTGKIIFIRCTTLILSVVIIFKVVMLTKWDKWKMSDIYQQRGVLEFLDVRLFDI